MAHADPGPSRGGAATKADAQRGAAAAADLGVRQDLAVPPHAVSRPAGNGRRTAAARESEFEARRLRVRVRDRAPGAATPHAAPADDRDDLPAKGLWRYGIGSSSLVGQCFASYHSTG